MSTLTVAEERAALTAEIDALKARRKDLTRLRIQDCIERGLSGNAAAAELGWQRNSAYVAAWRYGLHFAPTSLLGRSYEPIEIIPQATVKATAIAYRGKASAAQIGAAVGVTRNSIIGHWFRSRQSA